MILPRLHRGPFLAAAAVAGLLLAGCAAVPEDLQPVPERQPELAEVRSDPDSWIGSGIVWGGVIATVVNEADGTRLEILSRPLGTSQRPVADDRSEGRFHAFFAGFLDPQVYAPMREVTVRGTVTGVSDGAIGAYPYRFPEVAAAGIHLWPVPEPAPTVIYRDPFWDPWYPYYRHPWPHWRRGF